MELPQPQPYTFSTLLSQIDNGVIKIPQFQRDFVWTRLQSAKVIDSIIKGYPIGTFILWKTSERLRSIRNIGGIDLPEPPAGDKISYVLDGQQRLTSLFVSLKALKLSLQDGIRDYAEMYIDLVGSDDDDLVMLDKGDHEENFRFIQLSQLLEGDFQYLSSFPTPHQEKLKLYRKRLENYMFSVIQVNDVSIDVATEIFTRLNIGGRALTVFEIMVAKTFDHKRDFDLLEKVEDLGGRLDDCSFGRIPNTTMLQAAAACISKDITKKSILKLEKKAFIDAWNSVDEAIMKAIDHLRIQLSIPVSNLLPYPAIVVLYTYFYYKSGLTQPNANQRKALTDLFWRVCLASHYSQGLEGRLNSDLRRIDKIIEGENFSYDWPVNYSALFIEENGWFSTGRSFIKAILCLLAAHGPESFNTGAKVTIRNNWLSRANSKNYHHFFPKSFMEKQQAHVESWTVNHIANITFADDHLNKNLIRAKPPSDYLKHFQDEDPNLKMENILSTHLIDMENSNLLEDDYDTFFHLRCKAISSYLSSKIIPQEIDREVVQVPTEDDLEETV